MGLPLAFRIGFRFSRSRRRSGSMVSLISVISTIGIALGVAVLIIGLSAMNGFERELNTRILSVVPHGEIYAVNPPMRAWPDALTRIEAVPGVAAAAPYIAFTGLIERNAQLQVVQARGVDLAREPQLSALPSFVRDNAWAQFQPDQQQIIIGQGLADTLGVRRGDWVTLLIPDGMSEHKLSSPQRIRLQIAGILQLSGQLDHTLALLPLADAQRYLGMGDGVTGIAIKADDPFAARQRVYDAGKASGDYVYIASWMNKYGFIYRDIQMIRVIMYLAMVLVIGVACFNIVSTLVMAVKDRSSDIAVLRTLGAKDSLIRAIFIWYGLLTGLTGSVIGVVIGVIASLKLTGIMRGVEKLTGARLLSGDIYFIDFLPSELHALDAVCVFLTALALSLLASWYPARRASRIDPARVLSGQ